MLNKSMRPANPMTEIWGAPGVCVYKKHVQGGGWRWGREVGLAGVGWRGGEKMQTTVIEQ